MAAQSAIVMDTIFNLRRALDKEKDLSESDSEPPRPTNRGNKLMKKAKYFHEGELGGHRRYKKKIEHAGHTRYILHRIPKRYDEEGYALLSEDEDEEADREAAERNPYNDIQIEKLLMPLTSAHNLSDHPTLSIPYKSEILSRMVEEALDLVHKERKTLVNMKLLLTQLRGDRSWVPCGDMCMPDDDALFGTEMNVDGHFTGANMLSLGLLSVKSEPKSLGDEGTDEARPKLVSREDQRLPNHIPKGDQEKDSDDEGAMELVSNNKNGEITGKSTKSPLQAQNDAVDSTAEVGGGSELAPDNKSPNNDTKEPSSSAMEDTEMKDVEPSTADKLRMIEPLTVDIASSTTPPAISVEDGMDRGDTSRANSNPPTPSAISSPGAPPPRMLTRRRANARGPSSPSRASRPQTPQSPTSSNTPPPPLHPLYLPPASSLPSRDLGLPPTEADETRRLLHAWVQKQEEVIRGAERLYEGHLKALRMRETVWRWCRAEKHANTMSDGEDWVDEEEWGLEGELKKGMEEGAGEETEGGKKTRGRRVAGS